MENKVNCFVSYCHTNVDRSSLDFFIKKLKDKRQFPSMNIHYDRQDNRIRNWDKFIENIKSSHIVIVICSPTYKTKTIEHSDGVYKEFVQIKDKYYNSLEEAERIAQNNSDKLSTNDIANFDLIPIILQGERESSVPNWILTENIKYHDLSNYNIVTTKEKGRIKHEIIRSQKDSFALELKSIKARIANVSDYLRGGYIENYLEQWQKLSIDSLFKQTKADYTSEVNVKADYHNTLFVKTYAYKQVATQAKYIFIGRKGSGKSALLQASSQKLMNRFSYIIPIDRSNIDIIELHNIFNEEIKSDSKFLSKRIPIFSYTWRLFFRLLVIESIIQQTFYSARGKKNREYHADIIEGKLLPVIEKITDRSWEDYITAHPDKSKRNHFFVYSLSAVMNYFKKCIKDARAEPEYFWADIESRFNYNELLKFVFGHDINSILESIVKYKRKSILITFDDADSYYSSRFYDKDERVSIQRFELDFLYSLISLVNDFKQLKKGDSLASYFDFIVTVSSDHLFEIISYERDSYRFNEYYSVISWTGIELALMLRKRLAVANDFKITKSKKLSVKDTLLEVLNKKMKYLPSTIKFTLENGSRHEMHIFLYVLRFTFWRPRDILRYFAKLIVHAQDQYGVTKKIDSEMVRLLVRKSTRDVIESEFINEYLGYIDNIKDLIHRFDGCEQIISFEEIEKRIGDKPLILSIDNSEVHSIVKKVKYLYQLGFIGIYATLETQRTNNLKSDTAFIFNEGADIIDGLSDYNKNDYLYTIHPIFQSYLHLKMDPERLLSNYSWDYLEEMEELMTSSNHSYVVNI